MKKAFSLFLLTMILTSCSTTPATLVYKNVGGYFHNDDYIFPFNTFTSLYMYDKEKIDPNNGYMLSPLYDKLFDRGFITFTEKRHVILSEFISPYTWKQIGLKNDTFVKALPMDDKRMEYLKFHRSSVFKGSLDD